MNILYRKARPSDASGIAGLTSSYSLEKENVDEKSGFLVSGYDEDKYRELLQKTNYAFVALENERIVGFVMAFPNDVAPLSSHALKACENLIKPFILIKQVCVSFHHTGQGIAASLYKQVFQAAGKQVVLAAIVTEPKNDASIAFHEKVGFAPFIHFIEMDGMPRSFWKRG